MSDLVDIYLLHAQDAKIVILERGGHFFSGKVIDPYYPIAMEDFQSYEEYHQRVMDCEDILFTFTQKWDGCQNVKFEGQFHSCSNTNCDDLANAMKTIRYIGRQYFAANGYTQ